MFLNHKDKHSWKLDGLTTNGSKKLSKSIDSNRDRKVRIKKIKDWLFNKA